MTLKSDANTKKSSTIIQDFTGWLHTISLNFSFFYHICHIPLYIVLLQFTDTEKKNQINSEESPPKK